MDKATLQRLLVLAVLVVVSVVGTQLDISSSQLDQILGVSTDIILNEGLSESTEPQRERVLVTRIIDGDTFEIADGRQVRYIGIDTPETKHPNKEVECFGEESALYNQQLIETQVVELERDVSDTDRYGRLLRYVWLDDELLNEKLVAEGYAQAASFPPDIAKQDLLQAAQERAKASNLGLWGEC